jgi:D-lyxose ketol-isomerase
LCWLLTHTQFNDGSSSMVLNFNKGNAKRGVSPRLKIWPESLSISIIPQQSHWISAENYYPLANEVAKGKSNATVRPSVTSLWTL